MAHPAASVPRDESTALTVHLVAAPPPDPVSPAEPEPTQPNAEPERAQPNVQPEPAQPNALNTPAVPGADKPKRLSKPSSHPAPLHTKRTPRKPKKEEEAGVYTSEGAQELPQGTAVYQVFVGTGGTIQSIVLARSSGVPSYDAAGVTMIRNSMMFDPPPAGSPGAIPMIVTINFSPATD